MGDTSMPPKLGRMLRNTLRNGSVNCEICAQGNCQMHPPLHYCAAKKYGGVAEEGGDWSGWERARRVPRSCGCGAAGASIARQGGPWLLRHTCRSVAKGSLVQLIFLCYRGLHGETAHIRGSARTRRPRPSARGAGLKVTPALRRPRSSSPEPREDHAQRQHEQVDLWGTFGDALRVGCCGLSSRAAAAPHAPSGEVRATAYIEGLCQGSVDLRCRAWPPCHGGARERQHCCGCPACRLPDVTLQRLHR
jgi:hypothetical protein